MALTSSMSKFGYYVSTEDQKINKLWMPMSDKSISRRFVTHQESLLDSLYAATSQQDTWDVFLHELIDITDSRSARMLLMNQDASQVLQSVRVNIDSEYHQRYVDYYVNACPWRIELSKKPSGKLYSTYLDFSCDQHTFYRSEFFNDWAREQDIHHGICGTVFQLGEQKVQLLLQRSQGHGFYSEQVRDQVNQFLPHLRQALRMNYLQESMQLDTEIHQLYLANRQPFLLLDKQQKIIYQTPGLQSLLQACGIGVSQNQLVMSDSQQEKVLLQTILQVGSTVNTLATQEKSCLFRRENARPVRCMITPVYAGAKQFSFWLASAQTVLYFYDPDRMVSINLQKLMNLFGLTESESKVCRYIAQGYDPQQIADRESRSFHTVRTQLKSVFNKLHCTKQSQVASVVLNSPAVSE